MTPATGSARARSVHELFDLKGRVALVTGGAGPGFGAQISEALAEAGAHVVITSRDLGKAEERAQELRNKGFRVLGAALEVTLEESVQQAVQFVVEKLGRIDILFNSAAANHLASVEQTELEPWNRVLATNITGAMLVSRAVAPHMRKIGAGVIVNVSSIYGVVSPDPRIYGRSGLDSPLVYGVSKAAVLQMTRYLATHWAPQIRVNCLTPGGLANRQDPTFVKNYVERTPLGRMAGPEDLKGAALFLSADASAWVTGHNLVVDGGWTAW